MNVTRIKLQAKDIMKLYSLQSLSGAYKKMAALRRQAEKEKQQPVTIFDVSHNMQLPVEVLLNLL